MAVMSLQDLSTDESGLLQVTLEGIGLKFPTRRVRRAFYFIVKQLET